MNIYIYTREQGQFFITELQLMNVEGIVEKENHPYANIPVTTGASINGYKNKQK